MKKIEVWQTTDGEFFETLEAAAIHQNCIENEEWYSGRRLYDDYGENYIGWNNLMSWLIQNKETVLKLLNNVRDV